MTAWWDGQARYVGLQAFKGPGVPPLVGLYALSRADYFSGLDRKTAAPVFGRRLFSTSGKAWGKSFEWSRVDGFGNIEVGYRSGQTGQTVNLLA